MAMIRSSSITLSCISVKKSSIWLASFCTTSRNVDLESCTRRVAQRMGYGSLISKISMSKMQSIITVRIPGRLQTLMTRAGNWWCSVKSTKWQLWTDRWCHYHILNNRYNISLIKQICGSKKDTNVGLIRETIYLLLPLVDLLWTLLREKTVSDFHILFSVLQRDM